MAHRIVKLTKVKYTEWQASLFGASLVAIALGAWMHDWLDRFIWPILIVGILLHSWGMYKMYRRNM